MPGVRDGVSADDEGERERLLKTATSWIDNKYKFAPDVSSAAVAPAVFLSRLEMGLSSTDNSLGVFEPIVRI